VVGRDVRTTLLFALTIVAVATVVGAVLLRPDGGKLDAIRKKTLFAAPRVTTVTGRARSRARSCRTRDVTVRTVRHERAGGVLR
jgi:hypothetical protein